MSLATGSDISSTPSGGEEPHMRTEDQAYIVDRRAPYDPALSWTAVGVLMRLRADSQPVKRPAPTGPSQALEALAEELCEGRPDRPADVLDALNELITAGYLKVGGA